MTPDEFQRTVDFIVQNQAESHGRMDRIERLQGRLSHAHERSQQEIDTLVEVTRDLVRVSRQTIHRVQNLESQE